MKLETDKKRIIIEDKSQSLKLKLKLYKVNPEDEDDSKMAMRFIKVQGDLMEQQKLLNELITYLEVVIVDDEEDEQ